MHVSKVSSKLRTMSESLGMELQTAVLLKIGAGKKTQGLYKSSSSSKSPGRLSSHRHLCSLLSNLHFFLEI